VGLFDFFKNRRVKESAVHAEDPPEALGSFAKSEGQPVVGKQVAGGDPQGAVNLEGLGLTDGLAMLSQLGPMIQKAMAEGNVTVEQGPTQTIDMRGTGLREEMLGIMKQHGIDPEAQTAQNVDAGAYGDMQKQLLEALAKRGIDPNAAGSSLNFQIEKPDDD
jgi:hypothetical protein